MFDPPALPRRVPSLDGLRGISIALVILGHLVGTSGFPLTLDALSHVGNLGVRTFFVISGFLITTLLLREWGDTGRISLTGFYRRRVLRIFPAYFFYIGAMAIAWLLAWIELENGDIVHALTFTMNYHHVRSWYLNHLWSLSVEEQFYVLWPVLLALAGVRRSVRVVFALVLFAPLIRLWMWQQGFEGSAFTREFQAVADSLGVGCLLSVGFNAIRESRVVSRMIASPLFLALPFAGVLASVSFGITAYYIWGQSIANLAVALGILWAIERHDTRAGRVLNSPAFVWAGTLSYSLYLWQEPFLNAGSNHWTAAFPANLALTILLAAMSYRLVERPFLRLK